MLCYEWYMCTWIYVVVTINQKTKMHQKKERPQLIPNNKKTDENDQQTNPHLFKVQKPMGRECCEEDVIGQAVDINQVQLLQVVGIDQKMFHVMRVQPRGDRPEHDRQLL